MTIDGTYDVYCGIFARALSQLQQHRLGANSEQTYRLTVDAGGSRARQLPTLRIKGD